MKNELPAVYTHGWSARVRILLPAAEARSRLLKLGWNEKHCGWRMSEPNGGRRWDIKGGAWLTSRKPDRSSGLYRRNSEWHICLYNLSIQQGDGFYFVNIGGVRRSDLDRVCGSVLGLTGSQWEVVRWQKYERYVVLSTRDAQSLADAVNSGTGVAKANTHAKEYMVKDLCIPVTIRVRTRMNAEVVVYRINPGRGVTSSWKLEARLNAKASSGKSFCEDDAVRVLDRVLSDLVDQYGLNPLPKPARWEPRDVDTAIEREATLPDLKGLCASAFRGSKPVETNSNTPWPFMTVVSSTPLGTCGAHPLIRDYHHSHSSHHEGDYLNPVNLIQPSLSNHVPDQWESKVRLPWISLSREIVSLPQGTFSEVVLAPFESPGPFIRTLATMPHVKMAVSVLTSGIDRGHKKGIELVGHEMGEILHDHPMCQDDVTHWVLVVDSDVMLAVVNHADNRPLAAHVSDYLAHACRGWRKIAEETGLNILLVTYDARPVSGRGPWKPNHNLRDTRVRSLIGHAGRYHAHMRYRVESYEIEGPRWTVVLKDEIDGIGAGRLIWTRPGVVLGKRGKLQELDELDELLTSSTTNQTAIMTSGLPDDDLESFVGSRGVDE